MADMILVQWVLLGVGLMSTLLQTWFAFSVAPVAASNNKMTGGVICVWCTDCMRAFSCFLSVMLQGTHVYM